MLRTIHVHEGNRLILRLLDVVNALAILCRKTVRELIPVIIVTWPRSNARVHAMLHVQKASLNARKFL